MTVIAWAFAAVAACVHVLFFAWETVLFARPVVHRGVFGVDEEDLDSARVWAYNVGVYNLCLGLGCAAGVVLWILEYDTAGRTLVIYTCVFMIACALALVVSRGRSGVRGLLIQGGPALIALTATLLA